MIDTSIEFSFLFARLNHPSGMVRERTCVAIARLLVRENSAEATRGHLQKWLASQRLESVAISALLIWIRAKMEEQSVELPTPSEFLDDFPLPSLLSWLLASELHNSDFAELDWKRCCSSDPPVGYEPEPIFHKYLVPLTGSLFARAGETISGRIGVSFLLQWSWEWAHLVQSVGCKTNERTFWQRGDNDSGWYPSYNFLLTDTYKSAFLRALAWTQVKDKLRFRDALYYASMVCPIDLALWRIAPKQRPKWWPRVTGKSRLIDTAPGEIVAQLDDLWRAGGTVEDDWLLVAANGFLGGDQVKLYLELYGLFQWCVGGKAPALSEIRQWCAGICSDTFIADTRLRTTGKLLATSLHTSGREKQFGHWVLAPLFEIVPFAVDSDWQWWRYYRKLWAPATFLIQEPLTLEATEEAMLYKNGSDTIALWMDWTDDLAETIDANLPPFTGQCLLVNRDFLNRLYLPGAPAFCWVWAISAFHRPYSTGKFNMVSTEGEFGARRLILP